MTTEKEVTALPVPKDMNLHQLVQLSCEIKQALTDSFGELTPEVSDALMKLEQKLPSKADGYKFIVDDLENEAALWKKRATDFLNVAKSFDNYAKTMKEAILGACKQMGVDEILGNEYRWKLQKAKPTVIIDDEKLIPSGHKEIVQTPVIKKDGILEDLKQGIPVPGAHLEESLYVRCYPNKQGVKSAKSKPTERETKQIGATPQVDAGPTEPNQKPNL